MPVPCITLTDNGSLRPDATFSLRALAKTLSERVSLEIHPVSLLHSSKISVEKLHGQAAQILEPFLRRRRELGENSFLVLPLFFGPSAAIAEYLPQRVTAMREELAWPELEVRIAPSLVDRHATEDYRMAEILADLIENAVQKQGLSRPAIGLVDHGTPRLEVTLVRNFLAEQLRQRFATRFGLVSPCSMERRDEPEYDYNEPLLERLLGSEGFEQEVIVSMLFLQPGRHAGAGGDVAEICANAEARCPGLRTFMTDLVGTHPRLLDLLAERLEQGQSSSPI